MDDRDRWWGRVREIHVSGATWWWWWWLWPGIFQFGIFLCIAPSAFKYLSTSRRFSGSWNYFFIFFYLFALSFILFLFPLFSSKFVWFFCIRLLDCPCAFSNYLLVEFSFIPLECSVLFLLLRPASRSFKHSFFQQYLWINLFYYNFTPGKFSHICLLMAYQWSLSNNKSPRVSRTLLSILADLNKAVVWMILISPPISNSSSLFLKLFGNVPTEPNTNYITINLMFQRFFFCSLARFEYLYFFWFSFVFTR